MSWLAQNWDKVLIGVVPAVVSGVVGFYSAKATLDVEIANVKRDLDRLAIRLQDVVDPKLRAIDNFEGKINSLELRFVVVETHSTLLRSQTGIVIRSPIERGR